VTEPEEKSNETEDGRVYRLEEEVQTWLPASHAMWSIWAIIQARDDILARVDDWTKISPILNQLDQSTSKRPITVERGKLGELMVTEGEGEGLLEEEVEDFDYLRYAMGRMLSFRMELDRIQGRKRGS